VDVPSWIYLLLMVVFIVGGVLLLLALGVSRIIGWLFEGRISAKADRMIEDMKEQRRLREAMERDQRDEQRRLNGS